MKLNFTSYQKALKYLEDKMLNNYSVDSEILISFSDEIISQKHFTFIDPIKNGRYNASIIEDKDGFKVNLLFKKYSLLVQAAADGNIEIFKQLINKSQSQAALSLAFEMAILKERLNIIEYYYSTGLIKNINLFKEPLLTALINDRINSFKLLILHEPRLPDEILASIFHNNSYHILYYLLNESSYSVDLKELKYQTDWALNGLRNKNNESTELFKKNMKIL